MSIETLLTNLTAAIEANTAAMLKSGGAAAAGKTTGEKKTAEKKGPTREEMEAALSAVKEKHGTKAAKEIIADVGKAAKMAEIEEANFKAVLDAAKAKEAADVDEGM